MLGETLDERARSGDVEEKTRRKGKGQLGDRNFENSTSGMGFQ